MKISEVLRKENEKKEYMFKNRLYKVVVTQRGITRLEDHAGVAIENVCNLEEVLNGEFEEVIDWSKVPVDTLVEVSDDGERFTKRYFAKYEGGIIFAWGNGRSSKTAYSENDVVKWEMANIIRE